MSVRGIGYHKSFERYYAIQEYLQRHHRDILLQEYQQLCKCRKFISDERFRVIRYPVCVSITDYLMSDKEHNWITLRSQFWESLIQVFKEKHPEVMMELYLFDILS